MPTPFALEKPLFEHLDIWIDDTPKAGTLQMAFDEVLMENLERPLFRHYRWDGTVATFGLSQSAAAARKEAPGFDLVRRWTGGGVVRHDRDWTFSLLVPRNEAFAHLRPAPSYEALHRRIADALLACGNNVRMASPGECDPQLSCFNGASLHDLLDTLGSKICGGAQRRTRSGLLQQGSIQPLLPPKNFVEKLAPLLAAQSLTFSPGADSEQAARELAKNKYGHPEWLNKVP